jgi:general nucleoside transport system ATP-binding protein
MQEIPEAGAYAIEMRGITKRFAGVVANDNVSFAAYAGEVHALVGENGAGKSTLMSILSGMYKPDEGSVLINGETVHFQSPRDAIDHGIGMVYQHFMLVEPFTVAENALLGRENQGTVLDTSEVEQALTKLSTQYGLEVDPKARIWQLSVGEQQRVEILRLLYRGARILVLDEPTAVLTPQESSGLIETLRGMAADGFCVIFISHKLDEVLAVADRVTVLRRGKIVSTVDAKEATRHTLARLMVGRELASLVEQPTEEPRIAVEPGEIVLETHQLRAINNKGLPALAGVDLNVRSGEILGIAGVAGNGQSELAEVITGLRPAIAGEIKIGGKDVTNQSPVRIADAGVAHVPEDRIAMGLIEGMDLAGNAILRDYKQPPISRGSFLVNRVIASFTDRLIRDYDVKTSGRKARVSTLSGGNQQKLLLGRELSGEPKLLVAFHPTRGVDIGATETIHRLLREQMARGAAILLISEDLDELLALATRIAVLYDGKITGTVEAASADPEELGLLMMGLTEHREAVAAHG